MPRQMPTTPGPRTCAQARGGSLLLTLQIGRRGSRRQRPLQDRPPTLQAFQSVLSRTMPVSTHGFHGSRSYLRRHGVQFRRVAIYNTIKPRPPSIRNSVKHYQNHLNCRASSTQRSRSRVTFVILPATPRPVPSKKRPMFIHAWTIRCCRIRRGTKYDRSWRGSKCCQRRHSRRRTR